MATPKRRKRKGKIKFKQTFALVGTRNKNNTGNVGHPALLNNAGSIKIRIKHKT
jgi:hypothetical protein